MIIIITLLVYTNLPIIVIFPLLLEDAISMKRRVQWNTPYQIDLFTLHLPNHACISIPDHKNMILILRPLEIKIWSGFVGVEKERAYTSTNQNVLSNLIVLALAGSQGLNKLLVDGSQMDFTCSWVGLRCRLGLFRVFKNWKDLQ